MADRDELRALAERVMALTGPDRDKALDEQAAIALGWIERRVSRLGLTGRTPGSFRWFKPYPQPTPVNGLALPNMTGPRKRPLTAAALLARAETLQ